MGQLTHIKLLAWASRDHEVWLRFELAPLEGSRVVGKSGYPIIGPSVILRDPVNGSHTLPQSGVGSFHVNPRFHPTDVGWNLGLKWKLPTYAQSWMGFIFLCSSQIPPYLRSVESWINTECSTPTPFLFFYIPGISSTTSGADCPILQVFCGTCQVWHRLEDN